MTNPIRRTRAALVALALTLALATPSLAASVPLQSSETLTVLPNTTLTGVPATIDYGSIISGVASGPLFTPVASSNNPTGLVLNVDSATAGFTSGANSIPRTARSFMAANGSANCNLGTGWPKTLGVTGGLTICSTTSAQSNVKADITPKVTVPLNQAPGTYTGTLIISVSEQP